MCQLIECYKIVPLALIVGAVLLTLHGAEIYLGAAGEPPEMVRVVISRPGESRLIYILAAVYEL